MSITGFLLFLIIGALVGWFAGTIMKGGGFGHPLNILVGGFGGIIGGYLSRLLAIAANGLIGSMVAAIVGALMLLYIIGLIKNCKQSSI